MLRWTKPGQFVLSVCVTFQGKDIGAASRVTAAPGKQSNNKTPKNSDFCFLLLGKKVTAWCWEPAAHKGTWCPCLPGKGGVTHRNIPWGCTACCCSENEKVDWNQAWSKHLSWKDAGEAAEGRQEDLLCSHSYILIFLAGKSCTDISKSWARQILAVWALPALNGDNSTVFMLLSQGYKYRLALFSIGSKSREIDKVVTVKDSILNSVPWIYCSDSNSNVICH